jgi:hypothetical protein
MELDDAEPRKPLLPPSQPPKGGYSNNTGKIVAPEEIISNAHAFVRELSRSDKIAFAGCCLVLLSCFLPWKETAAEGDILGIASSGLVALLGAVAVIGAIFIRVRRNRPKSNPLVPWGVQVGASFFTLLYTVVYITSAFDSTEVPSAIGNRMIMNSSPSLGVFLGLLGTMGALAGSVMGLRERT